MKPAKTYHFRIVASAGTNTYTSDDQTVTTGAKLSSTPLTSFSVKNASAVGKGFFITSFWQGTGSKVPFIFDTDGDVVWWYTAASGESTDGVSRARMSADSQSIWLVNEALTGNPLRRVTMDGLTTQTYSSTKASHDIAAVTADTMAYLDYSESDCNSIFEINNAGTTKEIFEPTGVTSTGTSFPSCHGNSVRYSKKEDFYTYSDWQADVAVVSRTGTLQWLLSKKVSGGHTAWGGQQHGTQLLDSSILIFANQGTGGQVSGGRVRARRPSDQGLQRQRRLQRDELRGRPAALQRQHHHHLLDLFTDAGGGRQRLCRPRGEGERLVRVRRVPRQPLRPPARHRPVATWASGEAASAPASRAPLSSASALASWMTKMASYCRSPPSTVP